MRTSNVRWTIASLAVVVAVGQATGRGAELTLDEKAAEGGEWGYRPANDSVSRLNPPSFSWRPQKNLTWEVECARDGRFEQATYHARNIGFNVHCPPTLFEPGTYSWRYRGRDQWGRTTDWSQVRTFSVAADANRMPMPTRSRLIDRVPKSHPRLFLRPEKLQAMRERARGSSKAAYDGLARKCESLLANPPSTEEPPKYPEGTVPNSDPWREIWWGNRGKTIAALDGAATLAFTHLIGGPEKYGQEARRILMECARWDPKGSTGYRYNDEAGMPYAYYFSRTYTFVNPLLSEEEKQLCRQVMKVRGEEMYRHLSPQHLWRPYSSHSNRAWHFLGEVGIAFLGEIEEAEDWVWFAVNVFFNVYPVWSDDDGGWHEGAAYWQSYLDRFTWWADVMREAMGVNAYDKPFFSQAGYSAMYLLPPQKTGGGFGDLTARRTAKNTLPLMSVFAAQAQNWHWQWYVEKLGGPVTQDGYVGFIRGELPKVKPEPPDQLPTSRLFHGIGQAYLNSNLTNALESVQVVFKSSPFGTQSHGYEANNSFLLWGYGQRLLIRSGYRDSYGSQHHQEWMWSTRSVNNITVNGKGQWRRSVKAQGEITGFKTTPSMDIVQGEAARSYPDAGLQRFTRTILFVKPELIVVYDRLKTREPSTFDYWLHAVNTFSIEDQRHVQVRAGGAVCDIDFLAPVGLRFEQTDQYDPNPRPRIKLREWHLTATTPAKTNQVEFVALYRPHRAGDAVVKEGDLSRIPGGYLLRVPLSQGELVALLPTDDESVLDAGGLQTKGTLKCRLERADLPIQFLGL